MNLAGPSAAANQTQSINNEIDVPTYSESSLGARLANSINIFMIKKAIKPSDLPLKQKIFCSKLRRQLTKHGVSVMFFLDEFNLEMFAPKRLADFILQFYRNEFSTDKNQIVLPEKKFSIEIIEMINLGNDKFTPVIQAHWEESNDQFDDVQIVNDTQMMEIPSDTQTMTGQTDLYNLLDDGLTFDLDSMK